MLWLSIDLFSIDRGLFEDEDVEDDSDMFAGISAAGNNGTGTVCIPI